MYALRLTLVLRVVTFDVGDQGPMVTQRVFNNIAYIFKLLVEKALAGSSYGP
jgi:hypothetical protein